jgi:hypothetical protein
MTAGPWQVVAWRLKAKLILLQQLSHCHLPAGIPGASFLSGFERKVTPSNRKVSILGAVTNIAWNDKSYMSFET